MQILYIGYILNLSSNYQSNLNYTPKVFFAKFVLLNNFYFLTGLSC
jgi:hypothetical protein